MFLSGRYKPSRINCLIPGCSVSTSPCTLHSQPRTTCLLSSLSTTRRASPERHWHLSRRSLHVSFDHTCSYLPFEMFCIWSTAKFGTVSLFSPSKRMFKRRSVSSTIFFTWTCDRSVGCLITAILTHWEIQLLDSRQFRAQRVKDWLVLWRNVRSVTGG